MEVEYFCTHLDGKQTYTITQEVLVKYEAYEFKATLADKDDRIYALCSKADEFLGTSHIEVLRPRLAARHLTVTDEFGHRCSGNGRRPPLSLTFPEAKSRTSHAGRQ